MPALTGIRFPLAIWVVVNHLSGNGNMLHAWKASHQIIHSVVDGAWIALGIFFAISGFVLTLRYRTAVWTGAALARYAVARCARVFPVYLLSLLILLPIIAAEISSGRAGSPLDTARVLLSYLFLLQGWFRAPVDWNTPSWSLSCEMFFYACFPVVILVCRRSRVWVMLSLAFAVAAGVRFLAVPTTVKPLMYLGDFLAGVAAAAIYHTLIRRGWGLFGRGHLLYIPSIAVMLLLLITRGSVPFMILDAVLRMAFIGLLLGLAFGCRPLSYTPLISGGKASYAIYILHIPILWWYRRWELDSTIAPAMAPLLYFAIVLIVAFFVCNWIEQPAEHWIRRLIRRWENGREKLGTRSSLVSLH